VKSPEDFKQLLKADLRREKFILGGEIGVLLFVVALLVWYFVSVS